MDATNLHCKLAERSTVGNVVPNTKPRLPHVNHLMRKRFNQRAKGFMARSADANVVPIALDAVIAVALARLQD